MAAPESESRFEGAGQEFHAKYMGSVEVAKSKGQEICQEAMQKLLTALKTRKEPKPRLIINLSFEGTRLKEMPPGINLLDLTFKHSQISYVWKDPRDQRSLGIVRNEPDSEDASKIVHRFHGIRTIKPAMPFLQEMQDLFRIVKERSAQQKEERSASVSAADTEAKQTEQQQQQQPQPPTQESRDRATSNLLGPDEPAPSSTGVGMPKNESLASLDDLGDIFSGSVTVSAGNAFGANSSVGAFSTTASGGAFNPFGQPTASSGNPFGQPQQPAMMRMTVPMTVPASTATAGMPFGYGVPQYQQPQPLYQQSQFAPGQFQQQQSFPLQQQQQFGAQPFNPYQQQMSMGAPSMSTNPFATGASLFDRQNSAPSGVGGDLLTPESLYPTAATNARANPAVKPDAFSDLVVGLTPSGGIGSGADPKRQQLSSKELFKPVDKPKTTLRDLANQSPRP